MLLMFAGLLRDALAADAASLSASAAEEAAPAEAAEPVQWDPSTRCYAPDMYRAETVSHSHPDVQAICSSLQMCSTISSHDWGMLKAGSVASGGGFGAHAAGITGAGAHSCITVCQR